MPTKHPEKIIEEVIYARLKYYLEEQSKLHSKQYGYRKGKSMVD